MRETSAPPARTEVAAALQAYLLQHQYWIDFARGAVEAGPLSKRDRQDLDRLRQAADRSRAAWLKLVDGL